MQISVWAVWGLLTLITLLPHTPWVQPVPGRDSGVYLYIGQSWLDGNIPYRDAWDHKPPLVFLIDAIGLWLGRGSQWGVWALQWLMLWVACGIGFSTLRNMFNVSSAMVATIGWIAGLSLVSEGGNLTEQYALTFQFAALAMICRSETLGTYRLGAPLIGVFAALAFLLRQNLIGLWMAYFVVHFMHAALDRNWKAWLRSVGLISAGFLAVVSIFVGYFAYQGVLNAFWDAAFHYNFVYSSSTWYDRLWGAQLGLRWFSPAGLHLLLMAGWVCAATQCFAWVRNSDRPRALFVLLGTAVLGMPIEMMLTGLSGRGYAHYYMTWLPMMAVLTACLLSRIGHAANVTRATKQPTLAPSFAPAWACGLMLAIAVSATMVAFPRARSAAQQSHEAAKIAESIRAATDEDDQILLWGGEVPMNFITGRKCPSRFCYQYPLLTNGYRSQHLVDAFLAELSQNPPALIIDTSSTNEKVPPLDMHDRQTNYEPHEKYGPGKELDAMFQFVARNYSWTETIDSSQWRVYRRTSSGTSLR